MGRETKLYLLFTIASSLLGLGFLFFSSTDSALARLFCTPPLFCTGTLLEAIGGGSTDIGPLLFIGIIAYYCLFFPPMLIWRTGLAAMVLTFIMIVATFSEWSSAAPFYLPDDWGAFQVILSFASSTYTGILHRAQKTARFSAFPLRAFWV